MSGHFHKNPDMEIARTVSLNILHPFAFEPKDRPALSPARHFDLGLSGQSRNFDLSPKRRLDEADWNFTDQIVILSLKNLVLFDMKDDIEITGRTSAHSAFAVPAGTQPCSRVDA